MTLDHILWLIPAFPLAATLVNGLFGKRYLGNAAHWVAMLGVGVSALLSLRLLFQVIGHPAWSSTLYTWISVGGFEVPLKLGADALAAVMLVTVTSISFLVHWYSVGYMRGDGGYPRFFTYLPLFTFSMLMLVLAANFLLLYVFWEAVGLCSYLLIGFWFQKKSATDAGKKAFLVNRVGDFGFAIGILLLIVTVGNVDYAEVFAAAPGIPAGTLTLICLLLFLGAAGKSAQLPLHVWLPDAMEGPTPVSALIHAATMVTAGVYLVARCHPLFQLSPTALGTVAVIGTLTALMAAAIAVTQTDLKRILAYSTISQLGYMFLGLGVGAYAGAIFHLFTHAFFKALLFLGTGSVMHAIGGDVDVTRSGRLFGKARWTGMTFVIGALALAGLPPLAGFWSKESILAGVFKTGHPWLFGAGVLVAGGTAFYVFRAVFAVFFGCREAQPLKTTGAEDSPTGRAIHESPGVMLWPLAILAVLSAVAGYLGHRFHLTAFLERVMPAVGNGELSHGAELLVTGLSIVAALAGLALAWAVYQKGWIDPVTVAARWSLLYRVSKHKFYFDEIYSTVIVRPLLFLSRGSLGFDLGAIDGVVNWCGRITERGGFSFARMQSGKVQDYLLFMSLGMAAVIGVWIWW